MIASICELQPCEYLYGHACKKLWFIGLLGLVQLELAFKFMGYFFFRGFVTTSPIVLLLIFG